MAEHDHMLDKHAATIVDALLLLKRTCHKVARITPAIAVPAEALPKIAKAIDPTGALYDRQASHSQSYILFAGIRIVAEETSGSALIDAAAEIQRRTGQVA